MKEKKFSRNQKTLLGQQEKKLEHQNNFNEIKTAFSRENNEQFIQRDNIFGLSETAGITSPGVFNIYCNYRYMYK